MNPTGIGKSSSNHYHFWDPAVGFRGCKQLEKYISHRSQRGTLGFQPKTGWARCAIECRSTPGLPMIVEMWYKSHTFSIHIYIYTYTYTYIHIRVYGQCTYIYIYYIVTLKEEREREREINLLRHLPMSCLSGSGSREAEIGRYHIFICTLYRYTLHVFINTDITSDFLKPLWPEMMTSLPAWSKSLYFAPKFTMSECWRNVGIKTLTSRKGNIHPRKTKMEPLTNEGFH